MSLAIAHVEGQTEVWVVDILIALLRGLQRERPTVLECGGFLGHTSARFAQELSLWGGTLIVAEYDPDAPERAGLIDTRLAEMELPNVSWRVMHQDAIQVIQSLPDNSLDFAYLDDDHGKAHVAAELEALFPKMKAGSLITGHDCFGVCDLQDVFKKYGGYALDLPRLGPAGGLGILQVG